MSQGAMALSNVENLVLCRLLCPARLPYQQAKIRDSLASFFENRQTPAQWRQSFEHALHHLADAALITIKPLSLTETGRHAALNYLTLDQVPARLTWRAMQTQYLLAKALDLAALTPESRKHIVDANRLRAQLLKRHFQLPLGDFPTLGHAFDALAWQQLKHDTREPFSLRAVIAFLLGLEGQLDRKKWREQILAKATGAAKTDANALRLATIRHWLEGEKPAAADSSKLPAHVAHDKAGFDVADFAQEVMNAARSCRDGRFGEHKVFISHIWKWLQNDGAFPCLTEPEFKNRLVEANREGRVALSRADLVEAMDPNDVAASETRYLNALFHFVQI